MHETKSTTKEKLTYRDAIAKGQRLLAFTAADITVGPPQSQFQDLDDLEKWGWASFTLTTTKPSPAANLIRALSTDPTCFPPNVLKAGTLNLHDETVTVDGKTYKPTRAHIQSVLNREAGILLAESTTTPAAMLNPRQNLDQASLIARLPKLRHWSDIAFMQWKALASPVGAHTPLPELKIVVRYEILNADTRAICSAVLASLRKQLQDKARPGVLYDAWLPKWPGITFSIESEEAVALCGTPNGSGVLWLLAQHKAELGHKTIEKVTLLYREGSAHGLNEVPTLVFFIKDVQGNPGMERVSKDA